MPKKYLNLVRKVLDNITHREELPPDSNNGRIYTPMFELSERLPNLLRDPKSRNRYLQGVAERIDVPNGEGLDAQIGMLDAILEGAKIKAQPLNSANKDAFYTAGLEQRLLAASLLLGTPAVSSVASRLRGQHNLSLPVVHGLEVPRWNKLDEAVDAVLKEYVSLKGALSYDLANAYTEKAARLNRKPDGPEADEPEGRDAPKGGGSGQKRWSEQGPRDLMERRSGFVGR